MFCAISKEKGIRMGLIRGGNPLYYYLKDTRLYFESINQIIVQFIYLLFIIIIMKPVVLLMAEHRTIERMVKLIKKESDRMKKSKTLDPEFISASVDFFRTYADHTHHGKEEDILFAQLSAKNMSDAHRKTMAGLLDDHIKAREKVAALWDAKERYAKGDKTAVKDASSIMKDLSELYPPHIRIEDKEFFLPVMDYLTEGEQDNMLNSFNDFDKKVIHDKYKAIVKALEERK